MQTFRDLCQKDCVPGAGQNIPGQNIPCHFFTPRTKHPTKICHPGQNIPRCFCHPGHNIPCHFCHPGHNIPCHFCHPGQNIPYSDCFFRVSLICDLHLLWHVLAVNALVWLSKWYKLDLKLIERQFHNVNRIELKILISSCDKQLNLCVKKPITS